MLTDNALENSEQTTIISMFLRVSRPLPRILFTQALCENIYTLPQR